MRKVLILALLTIPLSAQNAVPQITAEQKARFWRASAEVMAAQLQLSRAQAQMQAAQAEMVRTCGEHKLVSGSDGEPVCQPSVPEKTNLGK